MNFIELNIFCHPDPESFRDTLFFGRISAYNETCPLWWILREKFLPRFPQKDRIFSLLEDHKKLNK